MNYRFRYCISVKPKSVSYSINMCSSHTQAADFQPPKQESIYLITFSQCGDSGLNKSEFAELIVYAFKECSRSKILQWVSSEEMHQDGGKHFHMAMKLERKTPWLAVRNFLDDNHGIKVNFSDAHTNYFSAYNYVVKEDSVYLLSKNHPDLTNASAPRTTNATKKRKDNAKKVGPSKKKKKRLAVYDVVKIIQTKGLDTNLLVTGVESQ